MMSDRIDQIVTMLQTIGERLRNAQHVTVLTGAGISAESGIPTFRDAQTGLWSNFRAEDLATVAGFKRDPASVWNWYAERRHAALQAQPNAAHLALAEMERRVPAFCRKYRVPPCRPEPRAASQGGLEQKNLAL